MPLIYIIAATAIAAAAVRSHIFAIYLLSFSRYVIRCDLCAFYIYDFFSPYSFLCDSIIYSHTQNIYTYIHIYIFFFISIVLIRLYSNNAFKASTAILSDAMIPSIANDMYIYVRLCTYAKHKILVRKTEYSIVSSNLTTIIIIRFYIID